MGERQLRMALQDIANEAIPPKSVDLWPRISEALRERKLHHRKFPPRRVMGIALPALAVLLLLVLSLALIGPGRALAAIRGWLGYIPGVGIVHESDALRALAEPVSLERDGITVTIEQALLDAERTVIVYMVDGIPVEARARDETEHARDQRLMALAQCTHLPELRLSNGTALQIVQGGRAGWSSGYRSRLVFPTIPPEEDQATFFIQCLEGTLPAAAPENWELVMRFVPLPSDLSLASVLEVADTSRPAAAPGESRASGLFLENVIELEHSYILAGTFRGELDLPGASVLGISAWPQITDAQGLSVPFSTPSDLDLVSSENSVFPWGYEIPKGFSAPLTITLEAVDVEIPVEARFQLDVGQDPQVGQEWRLDQVFELADHTIHLVSAVRIEHGYEFHFMSDAQVSAASLEDTIHSPNGGFGGGQNGQFSAGFDYGDEVPTGLLEYRISRLIVRHAGPWKLTWQPPESNGSTSSDPIPQPCLTADRWLDLLENAPLMPDGLPGKMIAYGNIREDGAPLSPANAGVFVVDLSDAGRQVLGPGTWPSLSPDGTGAAYSGQDGIHIVDLDSGEDRSLPGTSESDYNPRWSPDGTRLAFVRTSDLNLYIIQADGSSLRRVTEGPEYELLIDWLPDGQSLAYVTPGPAGLQLRYLNIVTGEQREGFVIDAKVVNAAVSPDGAQIAFIERREGGMDTALYVASLDGSSRRLIAWLGPWSLSDPRWSPDGTWLSLGITNTDRAQSETLTAAINPTTCEVLPLKGLKGYVQDWSP